MLNIRSKMITNQSTSCLYMCVSLSNNLNRKSYYKIFKNKNKNLRDRTKLPHLMKESNVFILKQATN